MRRAYLIILLATSFACEESAPGAQREDEGEADEEERDDAPSRTVDAGRGGKGGKAETPVDASKPAAKDAGASKGSQKDGGSPAASGAKAGLPCDVAAVLDQHCTSCHAAGTPQFGAPMSLASAKDFQLSAPKAKRPVHEASIERIERDGPGAMPPSPQPPLSAADKKTLLTWLEAGAPAREQVCTEPGSGGETVADAGSGSAPTPDVDCDVSFELRAYEGKGDKFPVPMEDDHYECFYFKAEVGADTLATALSPLLDDTRVLHHWLLFAADNEDEAPSGTHRRCNGIHPGAYLMAAWLPGTPALVLPKDVGMEMPSGPTAQFILENHYNNTARYQGASDNSGVKVCATNKPKAQHAAIHWLGSENITLLPNSTGSAQGTCTPSGSEPIHILGVIPHLHQLGRHVTMTILRANGTREVMHEGKFEFENQTYYPKKLQLNAGDRVQTRCEYMNDTTSVVTLGEKTTQEMCYMFTLAYPVGRMNTGGDYRNPLTGEPFVQGPNRCML